MDFATHFSSQNIILIFRITIPLKHVSEIVTIGFESSIKCERIEQRSNVQLVEERADERLAAEQTVKGFERRVRRRVPFDAQTAHNRTQL